MHGLVFELKERMNSRQDQPVINHVPKNIQNNWPCLKTCLVRTCMENKVCIICNRKCFMFQKHCSFNRMNLRNAIATKLWVFLKEKTPTPMKEEKV